MKKAIVLCMVLLCVFLISGKILAEEKAPGKQAVFCDSDSSGRVDGFDAGNIGIAFGSKRGDKRYNERADCNNDGAVNEEDLKIANKNFGKTVPPESLENTQQKGLKPPTGFREK